MSVLSRLQPEIHEATGCYANWIPASPVSVGDFGIVAADRFLQEGNVEELGIAVEVKSGKTLKAKQEYTSGVELSVGGKARADGEVFQIDPKIAASVSLKFGHRGAFLYHMSGITIHKLAHTRQLYENLLAGIRAGTLKWKRHSVVVSEVWDAERATIMISKRGHAGMDLSGKIGGAGAGFLARAGATLAVTRSSGSMWKWLSAEQCAPFIGLVHPVIDADDGGLGVRQSLADLLRGRPRPWNVTDITPIDYVEVDGEMPKMVLSLPAGRTAALRFEPVSLWDFMSWSADDDEDFVIPRPSYDWKTRFNEELGAAASTSKAAEF
jgi:hypothetical protein